MAHTRFHVAFSPAALAGPASATLPAWRLVGGNNRVLGGLPRASWTSRPATPPFFSFARGSPTRCRCSVSPRHRRADVAVEIDNVVVARSARTYLRGRENLYNLAHFLDSVPLAESPTPARGVAGRVCLA